MPRQRRTPSVVSPPSPVGPMVWLRADYEFPSTFSYRMPDVSAQFAIGSPIPASATVKLALVDTAIRWSGNVNEGRRIFDIVKTLRVCVIPPRRVVRFRAFVKRLKPPHSTQGPGASTVESTGVRDYFLLEEPLSVFIEVPAPYAPEIEQLLRRIRRFGTSDSACWCVEICRKEPPQELCPQAFNQVSPTRAGLVVRLSDLTADSEFDGFNPFGGDSRRANLDKQVYVLPLTVKRSGETWAILERIGL